MSLLRRLSIRRARRLFLSDATTCEAFMRLFMKGRAQRGKWVEKIKHVLTS